MAKPLALLLMGPTASGKTELALQLARNLNGEIISVDSSLVYRGLDIGTAKPSIEVRAEVPHHLIDILDPVESYSAGRFVRDANSLIEEIAGCGKLPILVGGTMLYFHALLSGLAPLPAANQGVRQQIDEEAKKLGWPALHQKLAEVDPEAARRIHPNDAQRIQRALEVYFLTGRPMSVFWRREPGGRLAFHPIKVAVCPSDRAVLHRRIEQRFYAMLEAGLIEEVRSLYLRGDLHPGLPAIRSVGYRQVWAYLAGECDFAAMVHKAICATRQLAKRQLTWLRSLGVELRVEADEKAAAFIACRLKA
ncbi:MAG: tRNA (adenosine(37)-N6)-dimethylallyltransferase MiaA [Methylohalobius sp.]|nr:tRNA (adenosine(37)-N6)-dimethylallyltransferase MiaA [Methylohalobius sp.]